MRQAEKIKLLDSAALILMKEVKSMTPKIEFESQKFQSFCINDCRESVSARTTLETRLSWEKEQEELSQKVSNRVEKFYIDGCFKSMNAVYAELDRLCYIAPATMKKIVLGKYSVSRIFLYKFTIGLSMTLEEANAYFLLCNGGILKRDDRGDYIVINAIRDRDNVESVINEFQDLLGKKI